jgi:putative transcriptional regulator
MTPATRKNRAGGVEGWVERFWNIFALTVNHNDSAIGQLMTSVGEKLKQRRESLNLTQQQVADELGVTVTTVKNWEAGRHIPKLYLPQTKALCDLLKLSLDELVD